MIYKIVQKKDGELFSFSVPTDSTHLDSLVYKIGHVTKPNYGCGPLAALQLLDDDDAIKFLEEAKNEYDTSLSVLECEGERSEESKMWIPQASMLLKDALDTFPDTVLYKWLKPTREITGV